MTNISTSMKSVSDGKKCYFITKLTVSRLLSAGANICNLLFKKNQVRNYLCLIIESKMILNG